MKKEIVVNASKDRSRIAIVEDGELAELYVEHPDNVRTLGNIYLGRVRKVMPAIRAAFIDIGQKQDAFLHFSDLTDNLGALLSISGEKIPGIETPVLARAPQKRVADDENEPDVEDTLELEESDSQAASRSRRSSRSRSRNRSRNRRRGRNRNEEEEEQEEAGEATPFVIDLTLKKGRLERRAAEEAVEEPIAESEDETVEEVASEHQDPPSPVPVIDLTSSSSAPIAEEPVSEEVDVEESDERDDDDLETPRSRRRGRRGGRHRRKSTDEGDEVYDQDDEFETEEQADSSSNKPTARDKETARKPEQKPSDRKSRDNTADRSPERRSSRDNQPKKERSEKSSNRSKDQSSRSASNEPETPSIKPEELLKRDQRLIVKVTKEPISSKGSRVSTDISFAGRFLVLVPAADYVAVSKKIESGRERRRLRTLANSLRPEGFGVIVRTVAEGRDAKTLDTDMRLLLDKWRKIENQLENSPNPPQLLYEDVNMISSIIRDLFTEDFDRILVDDPKLHRNIKAYVGAVAPHMADRVKLHRSNTPLFRAVGIERSVEQVFSNRVALPSGGYLFIEHTEAMHVVDVNSGRAGKGKTQAENLLNVNLEAAVEIARQLRLRDLGGIIVIDFIDMWREADRRKVYMALKREFKKDRAVTKLLPMSDFGLIQITRQRLRPSITTNADETDTSDPRSAMAAAGASEIKQPERDFGPERLDEPISSEDLVVRLGAWLQNYRSTVPEKYRQRPIHIRVHPLFHNYLKRGIFNQVRSWKWSLRGIRFEVVDDTSIHPLDFDARDRKSGKPLTARYEPKDD